jgi:hypothetical protein
MSAAMSFEHIGCQYYYYFGFVCKDYDDTLRMFFVFTRERKLLGMIVLKQHTAHDCIFLFNKSKYIFLSENVMNVIGT